MLSAATLWSQVDNTPPDNTPGAPVPAVVGPQNTSDQMLTAGRFFLELGGGTGKPVGEAAWGDSVLVLRRDSVHSAYRDAFSRETIEPVRRNGKHVLPLAQVFGHLPVALLEGMD